MKQKELGGENIDLYIRTSGSNWPKVSGRVNIPRTRRRYTALANLLLHPLVLKMVCMLGRTEHATGCEGHRAVS